MPEPIPPGVRERVEARYRGKRWRVFVCAETDGDRCGEGTGGVGRHECEAGRRHRAGEGPAPLVLFVEVEPTRYEPDSDPQ